MLFSLQGYYFNAFHCLQRNLHVEILYLVHTATLQSILTVRQTESLSFLHSATASRGPGAPH